VGKWNRACQWSLGQPVVLDFSAKPHIPWGDLMREVICQELELAERSQKTQASNGKFCLAFSSAGAGENERINFVVT